MALSTSLRTTYPEEPQIYISSTTINLKPPTALPLTNKWDISENTTFEWHTHVTTPPNTPVAPIVEEQVQTKNESNNQQQSAPERSKDLFLPAFTYEESDDMATQLDKFMACERYHSKYHQLNQRSTDL